MQYLATEAQAVQCTAKAKYGGRFRVTVLPGDGIGPELMKHVREVFSYGGVPVDFEVVHLESDKDDLENVDEAIIAIKRNGVALKGMKSMCAANCS